ncbi:DEKNAAC104380 [Brettanomyces naardenensis]|uniref:Probable electron transfer flavoprotein subunit alpha n=1 Tax=Brettanomyces naardenensis TaxID=13370 RepID=A0A448YQR0_BRENA|nr:DEKNAAC104380 [Brettanomyces naardenensis]
MFSSIRSLPRRYLISARFSSTLAFLETTGPQVTAASLSTLNAAAQVGNPITAILVGSKSEEAAKQVSKLQSVSKILISKSNKYDHYLAEEVSPLLASVLSKDSDYTNFFVPASTAGKGILPRLGALLDVQPLSEIIKVVSPDTFVRPTYAGNAILTVKSKDKVVLASVRASAFEPVEESGSSSSSIEEIPYVESGNKTQFVSEKLITSERPDLGSAKSVVAGGRGLKSKEEFDEFIYPLADKLNAAVGASRAAVDAGFCDNSLQVGQTGKIVAPNLYLAVGISGAIQHLAGMKDSKVIVAINKDEEAPIFSVADIGLVGDLFEIVPELTKKI